MIDKVSYIQHIPGHKNSKGESAPWVIKSHTTEEILSSHKSEADAISHLRQMQVHKHMKAAAFTQALIKEAHCGPCSPIKFEAIHMLSDILYKTPDAFNKENLGDLSKLTTQLDLEPFVSKLTQVIQELEKKEEFKEKVTKLKHMAIALTDIQNEMDEGAIIPDQPGNTKKEADQESDEEREERESMEEAREAYDAMPKEYRKPIGPWKSKEDLMKEYDEELDKKEAKKIDPENFTSILEDIVQKIQSDQPNLDVAKQLVRDRVQGSKINDEDKQTILKNIEESRFNHVMPLSMTDRGSLLTYLYNSILKYKGLGVIKEKASSGSDTLPQNRGTDPKEKSDSGYGGDRPGTWIEPKGKFMRAALNRTLGTLQKGEAVIITGSKNDKYFFYVEKDPSLIGIVASNLVEPYDTFHKKQSVEGFLKCHKVMAKSFGFIQKLAADFSGLVDSTVLDQIQEIRTEVATDKERVVNQLTISPQVNANIQLADAAQYFTLKGSIPSEKDTFSYIRASMASKTGLPESTWSDEVLRSAIRNRKKANAPLDWSDKMMLMQQWHKSGKLSMSVWNSLMELLSSDNLEEIKVGVSKLFDKASEPVQKPHSEKTAEPIPPAPSTPPPPGQKYVWDADSKVYVLVSASFKTKAEKKKLSKTAVKHTGESEFTETFATPSGSNVELPVYRLQLQDESKTLYIYVALDPRHTDRYVSKLVEPVSYQVAVRSQVAVGSDLVRSSSEADWLEVLKPLGFNYQETEGFFQWAKPVPTFKEGKEVVEQVIPILVDSMEEMEEQLHYEQKVRYGQELTQKEEDAKRKVNYYIERRKQYLENHPYAESALKNPLTPLEIEGARWAPEERGRGHEFDPGQVFYNPLAHVFFRLKDFRVEGDTYQVKFDAFGFFGSDWRVMKDQVFRFTEEQEQQMQQGAPPELIRQFQEGFRYLESFYREDDWEALLKYLEDNNPTPEGEPEEIWRDLKSRVKQVPVAPETIRDIPTMDPRTLQKKRDELLDKMLQYPEGSPERKKWEEKLRAIGSLLHHLNVKADLQTKITEDEDYIFELQITTAGVGTKVRLIITATHKGDVCVSYQTGSFGRAVDSEIVNRGYNALGIKNMDSFEAAKQEAKALATHLVETLEGLEEQLPYETYQKRYEQMQKRSPHTPVPRAYQPLEVQESQSKEAVSEYYTGSLDVVLKAILGAYKETQTPVTVPQIRQYSKDHSLKGPTTSADGHSPSRWQVFDWNNRVMSFAHRLVEQGYLAYGEPSDKGAVTFYPASEDVPKKQVKL